MKIINILLIALMAFAAVSCKGNKDEAQAPGSKPSITGKYGEPAEYFPMDVGHKWTYNIKLADDQKNPPLTYGVDIWPMGKNNISYETRGILYCRDKGKRNLQLIIQVDSLAPKQGPLQYPMGVRLKIIRDDLGVYGWSEYNEGVYWAASTSTRWQVTELVLRDPMGPGAPHTGSSWGGWGGEPGYSMAMKFFGDRPGIGIGIGSHSHDVLGFLGPEDFAGSIALHFKRVVEVREDGESKLSKEDYLYKSFSEDVWYLRNVGLVRLVQTVGEVETMVWTLEGY